MKHIAIIGISEKFIYPSKTEIPPHFFDVIFFLSFTIIFMIQICERQTNQVLVDSWINVMFTSILSMILTGFIFCICISFSACEKTNLPIDVTSTAHFGIYTTTSIVFTIISFLFFKR